MWLFFTSFIFLHSLALKKVDVWRWRWRTESISKLHKILRSSFFELLFYFTLLLLHSIKLVYMKPSSHRSESSNHLHSSLIFKLFSDEISSINIFLSPKSQSAIYFFVHAKFPQHSANTASVRHAMHPGNWSLVITLKMIKFQLAPRQAAAVCWEQTESLSSRHHHHQQHRSCKTSSALTLFELSSSGKKSPEHDALANSDFSARERFHSRSFCSRTFSSTYKLR